MSEKEARALGSGSTITVEEDGKKTEYHLRPVSVQHLCDLEREALKFYKRQYLQTFAENADLLGDRAEDFIEEKMIAVARWDLDDIPKKRAFDVSRVPVNDKLKKWADKFQLEVDGKEEELTDVRVRALLSTALDQEKVKIEEVKVMTGRYPVQGKVRYDQWWVTGSMEGMVAFLYSSIRYDHPNITRAQVGSWPITAIFEGARKVESITAPEVKNG